MWPKLLERLQPLRASDRSTFIVMLVFGATALAAAFVLTLDKLEKLAHPDAILSCSINLVLNCGTVMETWQSSAFGFPNMLIGLMAFPVIITVAVAVLSGVKFGRRFLIAANIGYALGTLFSFWLFFESLYAIQVLCPWCLVVTFSCTMILAAMTHYNLQHDTFRLKGNLKRRVDRFIAGGYDKLSVFLWIVLLAVLVFIKFGSALFA